MNMVDLIIKKRDGGVLDSREIEFFIQGVSKDSLPDYQVSAMLMAMFLRGLNSAETSRLTLSMAASGDSIDLSPIPGIKADKHSTGGVADTTTLILVPLVASCGVPVVKMSGRGLGFTGGTLDKLESIPGFRTGLGIEEALDVCRKTGAVIMGQSADLCPADRKLYSLRDVTGTVDSIPLIAASIMSKKLAAGADAIVLDVKCGNGAFMRTLEDARALSRAMVGIGASAGRKVVAVITGMDQPLGNHIGNTLEVIEALNVLKGLAGGMLLEVTLTIGAHMLMLAGKVKNLAAGRDMLSSQIRSGRGLDKMREIIAAQGGDTAVCDDYSLFAQPGTTSTILSPTEGYVSSMDTAGIGHVFVRLGGGRLTKEQAIDPAAGIILHHRIGDFVHKGDKLCTVYGADTKIVSSALPGLSACFHFSGMEPLRPTGMLDVITPES